jgi:hypothetical protein
MNWLGGFIIAFVLAWAGAQNAHAVKLPALNGGAAVSQAGKSSTVAIGGAGNTTVRSPTPGSELGRVLGNRPYSVTPGDGAGEFARLSQKGRVPVAEKEVPAEIIGPVGKEALIGGAVGLITGGVVGGAIGAGTPLLLDWMKRSGVRQNPQTGEAEIADETDCFVDCYYYTQTLDPSPKPKYPSRVAACEAFVISLQAVYSGSVVTGGVGPTELTCWEKIDAPDGTPITGNSAYPALARDSARPPDSGTWYPATPQSIRDRLYKQPIGEGVVKDVLDKGGDVELGPTRVTGPAEVTGDKRVKSLPDGSKVEEQDTIRYGYDGGKVTEIGRRTTTTNISPTGERTPAGQTETTSGESEPTTGPEGTGNSEDSDTPPTDTPLPPVPDLYTRKYPQGMEGIYDEYKDQLKNTSLVQLAKQLMPNISDGGTCPSWPINLNFATWAPYGVHDVAPPCWIWDVAKAILILSALLLARALIFGG